MIQYRKPNVKEDEIKAVEETERQQVLLYILYCIILYCVYMYLEIISDSFPANLAFRKNYLELVF